jgi:hypothetical protein
MSILFNKPASEVGLLAAALGGTKFIKIIIMIGHTLLCCLSPTQVFNQLTSDGG